MIARCLKILVLVSLVPLALRATSLLAGHVAPPCSPESLRPEQQPGGGGGGGGGITMGGGGASASSYQRNRRRMDGGLAAAAFDARRFRPHGGGGFEADKRLAPTGSNPLHNLR